MIGHIYFIELGNVKVEIHWSELTFQSLPTGYCSALTRNFTSCEPRVDLFGRY